jgi:N-acetylmuramoyl-L-alanine amidase
MLKYGKHRDVTRATLVGCFCLLSITGCVFLFAGEAQSPITIPEGKPPLVPRLPAPIAPTFLIVIDPGHGGSDAGARITPTLAEKDITLSLARKLREQLQARHIDVKLLRDSDSDLTLDQRSVAANLARPAMFLSLHAEPGTALRIYTAALPTTSAAPIDKNSPLPWQSAQAAFANGSKAFSLAVSENLRKRNIAAQVRPAFVEPLREIAAASVAIEVPAGRHGIAIAEDQLVQGVADAIASRRSNEGLR